jgi:hypothetical protein
LLSGHNTRVLSCHLNSFAEATQWPTIRIVERRLDHDSGLTHAKSMKQPENQHTHEKASFKRRPEHIRQRIIRQASDRTPRQASFRFALTGNEHQTAQSRAVPSPRRQLPLTREKPYNISMTCSVSHSHEPAPERALVCDVARTMKDVADCWGLTYRAYLRQGLIVANPFGFHTSREALTADAAFIIGRVSGVPVGTATTIVDGSPGLPLDQMFHEELQALRRAGRRLMEIGLVAADRTRALPEVLRYAIQFGRHAGCTDVVCGMHPRRERLYRQLFAMEPLGRVCSYPALRNQPVRLMHGVVDIALAPTGKARLTHILGRPVAASVFAGRIRFDQHKPCAGPLAEFMQFVLQSNPGSSGVSK